MSDNHGHAKRVRSALSCFDQLHVNVILHCGDLEEPDTLEEFTGRTTYMVLGNCDDPADAFVAAAKTFGVQPPARGPIELVLDGQRIILGHGHERFFSYPSTDVGGLRGPSGEYATYLFHGHTHVARDERWGATRVINPGALQRAPRYTVATVDLADGRVRFWEISRHGATGDEPPREFSIG